MYKFLLCLSLIPCYAFGQTSENPRQADGQPSTIEQDSLEGEFAIAPDWQPYVSDTSSQVQNYTIADWNLSKSTSYGKLNSALFYSIDPKHQTFSPYGYCGGNPVIYVDKDGRFFIVDDLIISAVSFTVGYVSNGLSTGNWGWKSIEKGLVTAGAAVIGYETGGMAATALWGQGSAGIGYTLTAAGIGGGVGGASNTILNHYSDNKWRLNSYESLNWTQVGRSAFAGTVGGLAGGAVGFYSGDPISAGIVGGGVSGGISGSYEGDWMGGAMLGMVSGGVSSGLTVAAYNAYGNYLYSKLTAEQKALVKDGGCRALVDLLNDNGVDNQNIEFGPSDNPNHVGKLLGRDTYGSQMIYSQEGYGATSPSVLTAQQLSLGSGTLYSPGIQSNGNYWNGYGSYNIVSGSNRYPVISYPEGR